MTFILFHSSITTPTTTLSAHVRRGLGTRTYAQTQTHTYTHMHAYS